MKLLSGDLTREALLILLLFVAKISSSQVYQFTTGGATGSVGPTQTQINSTYASSNLNGLVVSNNGIQTFTVPVTGLYKLTGIGAQGAGNGGFGSQMEGYFNLIAGQVLNIIVGQQGENGTGADTLNNGGGGGGGSFIVLGVDSLLLSAGGGGGGLVNYNGGNASTITLAGSTYFDGAGDNGTGGYNGVTNGEAAGGGGFYTDGQDSYNSAQSICSGGKAFFNGATGGESGTNGIYYGGAGGFGGGGSGWHNGINRCGGGGGYSGGQGGTLSSTLASSGGGGGSYNIGDNQNNLEGIGTGNGSVKILFMNLAPVITDPMETVNNSTYENTTSARFVSTNVNMNTVNNNLLIISPNPTTGVFQVQLKGNSSVITCNVYDIQGRIVRHLISTQENINFDISELNNGVYYVQVGDLKMQKIVKV